MNSATLMDKVLAMQNRDRIPFCLATYEHHGLLIGKGTIVLAARSAT